MIIVMDSDRTDVQDFRPCTPAPKRFYSAPENTGLNKRPVFAFDNKITNFAN